MKLSKVVMVQCFLFDWAFALSGNNTPVCKLSVSLQPLLCVSFDFKESFLTLLVCPNEDLVGDVLVKLVKLLVDSDEDGDK